MDRKVVSAVILGSLLVSPTLYASERFSLSAGITRSTVDTAMPIGGVSPDLPPPTLGSDFSGTGMRLAATVFVFDWLGVEAGWTRFGKDERTSHFMRGGLCPMPDPEPDCPPITFDVDPVEQTGSGYWLAVAPTYNHGSWQLSAKLGYSRTEAESRRIGGPDQVRVRESNAMYGVAATYYFSERVGVRGDFDAFGSHARQFGLSLALRF